MNKNFYIFRHGESTFNLAGRVQGCTDMSVLTAKGRRQAADTAEILKNRNIEIIISSPLKRAVETGNIVAEKIHVPLNIDRRFTEVNIGIIEGLLYDEVLEKYGELYNRWRNADCEDETFCFPGGESKQTVRKRIFEALNHYAEQTDYRNIAVSGHGIILKQSLKALGTEIDDIPNGSVIHLQYNNAHWQTDGIIYH